MRRLVADLSLGAALLAATVPAVAHHGTLISYDRDKQWTREATVTSFHYANPHPQLFFDVVDDKGNTEHWSAEMLSNPSALLRLGWTKVRSVEALAAGKKINVTIAPSRAGGPVGLVLKITDQQGADLVSDTVSYPQPPNADAQKP